MHAGPSAQAAPQDSKHEFYTDASRCVQVLEALANKDEVPLQLPEMGTKRLPPRQAQRRSLRPWPRKPLAAQGFYRCTTS